MQNSVVNFKGIKGGLYILLDKDCDFKIIESELERKLESYKSFFQGTANTLITIKGKQLTDIQIAAVRQILKEKIQIENVHIVGFEPDKSPILNQANDKKSTNARKLSVMEEGSAKIIRSTIRNGQRVTHEGHIIIIGDVNPGAELIASGNILVMGSLKGMAHAGILGNDESVVAAYNLQPTQLRIANIITRSPDGDSGYPGTPELAYVKNERIVIEPYSIIRKKH